MNYAILLAGGIGTRLKSSKIPKQFLELGGIPVLQSVVDKFIVSGLFSRIVVVINEVWTDHAKSILSDEKYKDICFCCGGKTRQESLYNGVKYLKDTLGAKDDDKVVSHDVARPFITIRIIEDNIKLLDKYRAVDTVISATDTIVHSKNKEFISNIPDREYMFQGQTPQSFRCGDYIKLYENLDKNILVKLTDAARIFVDSGIKVGLVEGSQFNIKITSDFDLLVASALLGKQND